MELDQLNDALKAQDLELIIGIETHVRLNTKSKLFCSCPNEETETPNKNICSVCTGQMGVLPAINKEAITKAIYFGKAVKSTFSNEVISWDRKHYEYPDNPKNIQITQFHNPIIPDGQVSCFRNDGSQFTVNLTQVHIEEDAAKMIAERSRFTPRTANFFLKRSRDLAELAHIDISVEIVTRALEMLDIDTVGLNKVDREFLRAINETFGGGPVGIGTLATALSEDPHTLEEFHEPYLIQIGFIQRTPRGRELTEKALLKHEEQLN